MTYHVALTHYVNNGLGWEKLPESLGGPVEHMGDFKTRAECATALVPYQMRGDVHASVYSGDEEVAFLDSYGRLVWVENMDSADYEAYLRHDCRRTRQLRFSARGKRIDNL